MMSCLSLDVKIPLWCIREPTSWEPFWRIVSLVETTLSIHLQTSSSSWQESLGSLFVMKAKDIPCLSESAKPTMSM